MTLDDIIERCSQFSGYDLSYTIETTSSGPHITIRDKSDQSGNSRLCLLADGPEGMKYLRETYGRLRHWAITIEEQRVILSAMTNAVD